MSERVDPKLPEVSEALTNGGNEFEEVSGDAGYDDDGESDEYDDDIDEEQGQHAAGELEGDEEEDDDDDEEDAGNKDPKKQNGLTALLLGDPNAEEEEEEDVDTDEEYNEGYVPATPSNKKRTIDEVTDQIDGDLREESEAKKVKA